jgi:hypothetical protein
MKTQQRSIVYINTYGDTIWGMSPDRKGSNKLGLIIEKIRSEIDSGNDLDAWISSHFKLLDAAMVSINIQVYKEDMLQHKETFTKNCILIGKDPDMNDVVSSHDSISRCHCVVVVDSTQQTLLIDLHSANGTKVDNQLLPPYEPMVITSSSRITLGASTRSYAVVIDTEVNEHRKRALYEKLSDPSILLVDPKETTVFVGNLAFDANEDDLRQVFQPCGDIQQIKLPTGTHKGNSFNVLQYCW